MRASCCILLMATFCPVESALAFQNRPDSKKFALEKNDSDKRLWIEFLAGQTKPFKYFLNLNGSVVFRQYPPDDDQIDTREFFLHPAIIDELELSKEKQTSIANAFDEFEKNFKQQVEQLAERNDQADQTQRADGKNVAIKQIQSLREKLQTNLERILSRDESEKIRQIQLRFLVHQNGFFQTMTHPVIQREFGLRLTKDPKLLKQQQVLARELYRMNRKIADQAIELWLEDLSEEQRSAVKRRWKEMFRGDCVLQQLILQLDSKIKKPKFDPGKPFEYRASLRAVDSDVSGSCLFRKTDAKQIKMTELMRFRMMGHSFHSAHFRRDLEMVTTQVDQMEKVRFEWLTLKTRVNHAVGQKYNIKPRILGMGESARMVYTLLDPKHVKEYEDLLDKEAGPYCEKYLAVLLPHQRKLLIAVNRGIQIRSHGPLADILWGDLGKALELTPEQKTDLRKKADEVRKFMCSESVDAYRATIDEIIGLAAFEDRKKLRSLLGDIPQNWTPNIYGFAAAQFMDEEESAR